MVVVSRTGGGCDVSVRFAVVEPAGDVPLSGGVLDTVRVSGSDHAVMSSGLATSSSDLPATRAMDRSER